MGKDQQRKKGQTTNKQWVAVTKKKKGDKTEVTTDSYGLNDRTPKKGNIFAKYAAGHSSIKKLFDDDEENEELTTSEVYEDDTSEATSPEKPTRLKRTPNIQEAKLDYKDLTMDTSDMLDDNEEEVAFVKTTKPTKKRINPTNNDELEHISEEDESQLEPDSPEVVQDNRKPPPTKKPSTNINNNTNTTKANRNKPKKNDSNPSPNKKS